MTTEGDKDQTFARAPSDQSTPADSTPPAVTTLWWWLRAFHVRFRFLLIVLLAAGFVSQWPKLQSVWDRWQWRLAGTAPADAITGGHEYFCPMDAGVLSSWPAICPICSMDLVPRRKMQAQLLPEGVIARMQFSPYRIQLAGIRTSSIEPRELNAEFRWTGTLGPVFNSNGEPTKSQGLEVGISGNDAGLFIRPRAAIMILRDDSATSVTATAKLAAQDSSGSQHTTSPRLQITPDDPQFILHGGIVTATVAIPANELTGSSPDNGSGETSVEVLAVPESAVVDRGHEKLVFVETMPGTFDGVLVSIGRRCGGFYPVLSGLKQGQRVASAGAFLIDAETRLNPHLAAGYFGANEAKATAPRANDAQSSAAPRSPAVTELVPRMKLSPADQLLVDHQKICPVTELPLDSMGGPLPVMVGSDKVFICCAGCEARLLADPEKYLARLAVAP